MSDRASVGHNPGEPLALPSIDLVLAWLIYASALQGRKRRENLAVTRSQPWLEDLQAVARFLGDAGVTL